MEGVDLEDFQVVLFSAGKTPPIQRIGKPQKEKWTEYFVCHRF